MPTLDEMTTVTDDQSELTMSVLMTPDMANFSGNVHGGTILKLLDQVAYACASRYSGSYVVTLSVDKVNFKEPIYVGELVTFLASVNHVGRTSMEVGIRVEAQNIQKRTVRHTNSCYFTMVAVDEHGKPREVPKLNLDTEWKRNVADLKRLNIVRYCAYKRIITLLVACIRKLLKKKDRTAAWFDLFSSPKFNVLFRFSKIISELGGECRDN